MTEKTYESVESSEIPKPGWRSIAVGLEGMVATGHPLASEIALQVLNAGGNAVDAAVATAGILAVAQPMMSGLGGDVFLIYYDAAADRLWALNGIGKAPLSATTDWFRAAGFEEIPLEGMLSVAVPGAVDGYCEALRRWGTMPLGELWRPTIRYAERGVVVTERVAEWIAWEAPRLKQFPEAAAIYFPNNEPPQVGDRLIQRDLAATLTKIAERGPDVFYRGELATEIAEHSARRSSLLRREDLADHASEVYEPISVRYRDCEVFETAPPSQGFILLEILNLMEGFDFKMLGHNSADAIHVMVEAKKIAFDDRNAHFGDPAFANNPLEQVLSKEYARRRRADINMRHAAQHQSASFRGKQDTTAFSIVDAHGNAVSVIASLCAPFGCADVIPGTGLFLNNRAGYSFNLFEGHPNCVGPGKRPMHTMNCFVVMRRSRLFLVGGTPGGFFQPQWNAQVIANVIDYGMNVQHAVEAARWSSFPGTEPGYWRKPFLLKVEDEINSTVREELVARGHEVITVRYPYVAPDVAPAVQLIEYDAERDVCFGGSDPRGEGCALGW